MNEIPPLTNKINYGDHGQRNIYIYIYEKDSTQFLNGNACFV